MAVRLLLEAVGLASSRHQCLLVGNGLMQAAVGLQRVILISPLYCSSSTLHVTCALSGQESFKVFQMPA